MGLRTVVCLSSASALLIACGSDAGKTPTVAAAGAPIAYASAAASGAMQGQWLLTITVPGLGTFPVPATFKHQPVGNVNLPPAPLDLVYRETATTFSATFEMPAASSPTGAAMSWVVRGSKTTNNSVTGTVLLVTDTPSGTGYQTIPGFMTGQRQ